MSHEATNAVFRTRGQQTAADRLVLLALADHSAADGANCRPGLPRLADFSDQSRSTVIRSIQRLEGKCVDDDHDGCDCVHTRWIWVHRRPGRSSHYVLLLAGLRKPERDGWNCPDCYRRAVSEWNRFHAEGTSGHPSGAVDNPVDNAPDQSQADTTPPVSDWHDTRVSSDTTTRVTGDTTPVSAVTPEPPRSPKGSSSEPPPPTPPPADDDPDQEEEEEVDTIAADIARCFGRTGLGPDAHTAIATKLDGGWTAAQIVRTAVDQAPADVATPDGFVIARLSRHDTPPADTTPPPEDPAVEARHLAAAYSSQPWDHVHDALRGRGFDDDVIAGAHDTWRHLQQTDAA